MKETVRRPLCTGLLFFLAVWLAAAGLLSGTQCQDWNELAGQEICLLGKAADLYEPADGSQEERTFILEHISFLPDSEMNLSGEISPSAGRPPLFKTNDSVICYLRNEEEKMPRTGSTVKVAGIIAPFREAANPGEFDAAKYYHARGYAFSLKKAGVVKESRSHDRTGELLYQIRRRTDALFWMVLGEEDGGIASAMVLGVKKGLDADIKALYQGAGIAHLLAISGLHITMIGMGLFLLLQKIRMPLMPSALAAAVFLAFYGQMTGMSVSTRRAVLMFFLMLAARLLKRTSDLPTSLAVAACVILIPDTGYWKDPGFQLSFAAVSGAAAAVPMLQETGPEPSGGRKGRAAVLTKRLYQGVCASLGITLVMLPVLLMHYYEWNPWSVAANLLVIPLMSLLLLLLLFLAGIGFLYPAIPGIYPILQVAALPAKGIFLLYKGICRCILLLPGSSLHTGMPKLWQLVLFAAGVTALLIFGKKLRPAVRLPLAFLLTMIFLVRLPGQQRITMLDVGQGECICVETAAHHIYLLDAGSTSKSRTGQYQIVPFLKYSGVRRIQGIFISHWDEDHVNGLEDVLSWAKTGQVRVERLLLPDTELEDDSLKKLLRTAAQYQVPVERISAGQTMQDKKMKFTCLHPYKGETVTDRNQTSAVLKMEYEGFSALFTGDLEGEGENWLTQRWKGEMLDCDLLTAGHHGSANATGSKLLEAVSPQAVLISCGKNNRYGHPAPDTIRRLEEADIPWFVTAQRGAITVTVKKEGVTLSSYGS